MPKPSPLSKFALAVLEELKEKPKPTREVNPGVVGRLLRDDLVEIVQLPSPYKTRIGLVQHLQLKAEKTKKS